MAAVHDERQAIASPREKPVRVNRKTEPKTVGQQRDTWKILGCMAPSKKKKTTKPHLSRSWTHFR
jgi:hypothetical protein